MERSFALSGKNAKPESLKIGLNPFLKVKCRDQGNLIPKIADKAKKIKGDKLPKVTGWLRFTSS